MKKIIVAADSFKGCLSSSQIGELIQMVTQEILPSVQVTVLPISDGGEGLVEAVVKSGGFARQEGQFYDPMNRPLTAAWARREDEAVIESAQCSGLGLCDPHDPSLMSTYGTGLQLKAAAVRMMPAAALRLPWAFVFSIREKPFCPPAPRSIRLMR